MATVYKIEITSFWTNYTEEEMKKILYKALGQEFVIEIKDRK